MKAAPIRQTVKTTTVIMSKELGIADMNTIIGGTVFGIIIYYQISLLFQWLIGNALVYSFYLVLLVRRGKANLRYPGLWILFELIYGLINPIVYLISLQGFCSNRLLNTVGLLCLFGYWGTRFCLAGKRIPDWLRILVKCNIFVSMIVVLIFTVKDIAYFSKYVWGSTPGCKFFVRNFDGNLYFSGSLLLFYFVPLLMLIVQARKAYSSDYWRGEPSYLLLTASPFQKYTLAACVVVAGLCIFPFQRHFQEEQIRGTLLKYRSAIHQAGRQYSIDPRLIASVIYVNHRYYISPSRHHLENVIMDIWLADETSHSGLSESMDISIGLAQIKPVTAITAIIIPCWNTSESCYSKHARDVPYTIRENWVLTPPIRAISPMPFSEFRKQKLVADLLIPEKSIEYCAYILSLYAIQWETICPEWSIRDRPEILATLYQIGFERSHPKSHPRANTFGKRVQQIHETEWIQLNFKENFYEPFQNPAPRPNHLHPGNRGR